MAHLVSLDNIAHRQIRIDSARVEAAGAALNMVPVVLSEFLKLVVQYPIAFTKDKDTGRFACVALFGFHDGENLFVDEGRWEGIYVPLQVSRQPFFLGQAGQPGEGEHYVVCIDTEHAGIGADGERIFDADGQETACLEEAKGRLAELLNGEEPTRQFIDTLVQLKLLVPMQLEITFGNDDTTQVQGLYTIDDARLAQLDGDAIARLHTQGLLGPAYTMLASLGHIYAMIDRRNKRLARAA
ncbi:SapC protein [Pseudoduganella flava]|uniref:Peptidase n=1 Tax=Pseudoduganella flava TaxID=871742 RepID=A0A562PLF1_9BURK|nr:SapC family protein [Pseudoduganella flava]QGZ42316.1 peptidase [Pseudoduganella flava]TWI44866.1 SapC protein [Pseudoduganella flava]